MSTVFSLIFSANFLATIIRMTTPIMFASLSGLIVQQAGMMNLAVESTMLTSALMGVVFSAWTQNAWIGLLGAVITGTLMSGIIGYTGLILKADMVMNGVAFNLMMTGGTTFILYLVCGSKGMSSSLQSGVLPKVDIPILKDIPFLGEVLSGHYLLTYVAVVLTILMHILIFRTKFGLRLRLVGENAAAAESVGIRSLRMRMIAMCVSGAMAALGGVYLSMGYVTWFQAGMTNGRGFIGMAAASLGRGTPLGAFGASALFGTADALAITLSTLSIPSELVSMLPYLATIIGLIVSSVAIKKRIAQEQKKKSKTEQEAQ
jgi:simple sugar transport system permease protein